MGELLSYRQKVTNAMTWLGGFPETVFVGQSVAYDGQALFDTFSGVPHKKRIEMPVAEDMQMGFCIGLSLQGFVPVSFYPRFDFLILAVNQLVNHLDKISLMSDYRPKVIVRTAVGSITPLNPGLQHCQDHTKALREMLKTVRVVTLGKESDPLEVYKESFDSSQSTVVVEYMDFHKS